MLFGLNVYRNSHEDVIAELIKSYFFIALSIYTSGEVGQEVNN